MVPGTKGHGGVVKGWETGRQLRLLWCGVAGVPPEGWGGETGVPQIGGVLGDWCSPDWCGAGRLVFPGLGWRWATGAPQSDVMLGDWCSPDWW